MLPIKKIAPIVVNIQVNEQKDQEKKTPDQKEIEKWRNVSPSDIKKDEELFTLLTERLSLEQLALSILNAGKEKTKLGPAKEVSEWLNTNIPLIGFPASITKKTKTNVSDLLETLRKKAKPLETKAESKEETTKEKDEEEEDDEEEAEAEDEGEDEGEDEVEETEEEPEKAPVADLD